MEKHEEKAELGVFDKKTTETIFKLSNAGHFQGLKAPISVGKESKVYAAETKNNKLVAVKIYRLDTADFNRMYDYIKHDPRFKELQNRKKEIIYAWAQREFRNLLKAREAGLKVPTPLEVKNNVLVEEFIGENKKPAPTLTKNKPETPRKFFNKIKDYITYLYNEDMTHGDLSEFNILNNDGSPVLIDFSQCTTNESPLFDELFERDVEKICKYFNRKYQLGVEVENIKNDIKGD